MNRVIGGPTSLRGVRLAITGIGGFIGRRLALIAVQRGARVQGIELSPERAAEMRTHGIDRVIVGDVRDRDAMRAACKGADTIVHTAAVVEEDGDRNRFWEINVGGSVCCAETARSVGARKLIHLSSVMVYGFRFADGTTEDGPLVGDGNPYCETKIESELRVREIFSGRAPDLTILRPGDVYGPGSLPWIVRPLQLMRRRLFAFVDGGKGHINHLYVDNLCDAIFDSLSPRANGMTYNVTDGRRTTWREFYAELARLADVPRPVSAPAWLVRRGLRALELACTVSGRHPPARPAGVDFVSRKGQYSIERIQKSLGFRPRVDLAEGLLASLSA